MRASSSCPTWAARPRSPTLASSGWRAPPSTRAFPVQGVRPLRRRSAPNAGLPRTASPRGSCRARHWEATLAPEMPGHRPAHASSSSRPGAWPPLTPRGWRVGRDCAARDAVPRAFRLKTTRRACRGHARADCECRRRPAARRSRRAGPRASRRKLHALHDAAAEGCGDGARKNCLAQGRPPRDASRPGTCTISPPDVIH